MMQTAFINIKNNFQGIVPRVFVEMTSAPGFVSAEEIKDKETGEATPLIFCRLKPGSFDDFKKVMLSKFTVKVLTVEEGVKL